jgi:hypothetical protein
MLNHMNVFVILFKGTCQKIFDVFCVHDKTMIPCISI